MTDRLHYVTVKHERDEHGEVTASTLTFECRGDRTSACHNYPSCDCEIWRIDPDTGAHPHLSEPQGECWMQSWFDAGYEVTPHRDDETADSLRCVPEGSGPIGWEYEDSVIWHWLSEDAEPGGSR